MIVFELWPDVASISVINQAAVWNDRELHKICHSKRPQISDFWNERHDRVGTQSTQAPLASPKFCFRAKYDFCSDITQKNQHV